MTYEHFYQFYDTLMDDIPYHNYIDLVKEFAKSSDSILDIGCGTGNVLVPLVNDGFLIDGLDLSCDMLLITNKKLQDYNLSANLFCDDMKNISLKNYYNVIYSFLDTINYLENKEEVMKSFQNIFDALKTNGYFIFDVHSLFIVHNIFDGYSFNDFSEDFTYLWNTYVSKKDTHSIVEHELSFFVKQKNNLYKRLDEYHLQVVFPLKTYIYILEKVGFQLEKLIFDFDNAKTEENCDKIIIVAKKCN